MAIIDIHSRYVVHWSISNSMEAEWCCEVLEEAIGLHGKPEIFNTDQGSQFTSEAFTEILKRNDIQISMDGKGRVIDNIFIERLWRSVKQEHVYLYPQDNGLCLYNGLKEYFYFYNNERPASIFGLPNSRGSFQQLWKKSSRLSVEMWKTLSSLPLFQHS